MSDTKMLQLLLDGQSKICGDIDKLDKKLTSKIDGVEKRLTKRINRLGEDLAYLEDDAPTREEHNNLDKRVKKIEKKLALA